jgi:hypothetical protein
MNRKTKMQKKTKPQNSAISTLNTPRRLPPPPPKTRGVVSPYSDTLGAFEDTQDPGIEGCAEGNPLVRRNLLRIAARLHLMAEVLERADPGLDSANIAALVLMIRHYRTTLPVVLLEQLEAASRWFPLGLVEDKTVFRAIRDVVDSTDQTGGLKMTEIRRELE